MLNIVYLATAGSHACKSFALHYSGLGSRYVRFGPVYQLLEAKEADSVRDGDSTMDAHEKDEKEKCTVAPCILTDSFNGLSSR